MKESEVTFWDWDSDYFGKLLRSNHSTLIYFCNAAQKASDLRWHRVSMISQDSSADQKPKTQKNIFNIKHVLCN